MSSASLRDRLRSALDPVTRAAGFDLEEVTVTPAGRRQVVRLVIDADTGVSLDDAAQVAAAVSSALDHHDLVPGAYVLEVSSPGVDRPLAEPRHWRRRTGRLVRATLVSGGSVCGRIVAADEETVTLDIGGETRRLGYGELRPGRVQVEFTHAADDADEVAHGDPSDSGDGA